MLNDELSKSLEILNGRKSVTDTGFLFIEALTHKMVKNTQTIRWQIADELFVCLWPFCGVGV